MNRQLIAAALILAHSSAGEAQQHAHSTERLGTVQFPTSCRPVVQPQFNRGVALLHSFEFGASIRAFSDVIAADSTCGMAYWGIALSRWGNPMAAGNRPPALLRQGKEAAERGLRLVSASSDRERGWITAVSLLYDDFERRDQAVRVGAYERAMRELVTRFPADTEAVVFHAIALTASASPTDKTYANQLKAGRMLEALLAKQPQHPGLAHYIIHSYDYPALASKARDAARRYAGIAPSAAHALHMPSHTFTRVGMWEESVRTNMRSRETALQTGSISEALHASDYAVYANLQLGRYTAAKAILDDLPALAARFDPKAITGAAPPSAAYFALAAIPARWTLERRAWAEAAALEPRATDFPYTEAMTYFARAVGAARGGNLTAARPAVDSLGAIQQRLLNAGEPFWSEQVAIQHLAAQAWLELAEGRRDAAVARMRQAVVREDATEKNAVTPGPLAPAREQLGDMLMAVGKRTEAVAQYRATLKKEPGRRHSMQCIRTAYFKP